MSFAMMSRPALRFSADVNVVCDGNSLTAGLYASAGYDYPAQLAGMAPIAQTGATVVNLGVGGQTWRQMDGLSSGSSADVDGAWVSGKRNILVAWETTNSVYQQNAAAISASMALYFANRRAANSWHAIVALTTIPRGDISSDSPYHQVLLDVDAYMRVNQRAMGITRLVECRQAGGPFAFRGDVSGDFSSTYYQSDLLHLKNAGYGAIAKMVAAQLRRIPR